MHKVELGDIAVDKITGYKGTVIAITRWLHNCERITLQSNELKDGLPIESVTFDSPQVTLVSRSSDEPVPELKKTGGPSIKPERSTDPV